MPETNKNYLKEVSVRTDTNYELFIDPFQLYLKTFNKIPNRFGISLFKNKTEQINWKTFVEQVLDLLKSHVQFNVSTIQYKVYFPEIIIDLYDDNDLLSFIDSSNNNQNEEIRSIEAYDFVNKIFIVVGKYYVMFYYTDIKDIQSIRDEIFTICDQNKVLRKVKNKVNLITQKRDYLDLTKCDIDCSKIIDLDLHYNEDFKPHYKKLVDFLNGRQSGLCILNGTPGTGKTNLIRHIIGLCENQYIIVPNTLMESIASPQFTSFILEHKNSVLILEDCETLLMERENSYLSNGVSNILNITDGLYSDIFNIKIVATFNTSLENIDPALLREGRLVMKYTFDKLTLDKTNKLLKSLNKPKSKVELTLAQIYNETLEEQETKKPRKIGF